MGCPWQVLGSDIAGEVIALEPSCERLKVGDYVWGDIGANTMTLKGEKTKELGASTCASMQFLSTLPLITVHNSMGDPHLHLYSSRSLIISIFKMLYSFSSRYHGLETCNTGS